MLFIWLLQFILNILSWFIGLFPADFSFYSIQVSKADFVSQMLYFLPRANYLFPIDTLVATALFCMTLEISLLFIKVVWIGYQQTRIWIRGG